MWKDWIKEKSRVSLPWNRNRRWVGSRTVTQNGALCQNTDPQGQSGLVVLVGQRHPKVHQPPKAGFGPGSKVWGHRGDLQRRVWPETRQESTGDPLPINGAPPHWRKVGQGLGDLSAPLNKRVRAKLNKHQVHGSLHAEKSKSRFKFILKLHPQEWLFPQNKVKRKHFPENIPPLEHFSRHLPIRSQVIQSICLQKVLPSGIWAQVHGSNPSSTVTSCVTLGKLLNWSEPVSHLQKQGA